MLYILEKKLGLWPFWLIFESDSEKKSENGKFVQKSENLELDKIWIFWSNKFNGPPKFTEVSDWLKNSL